MDATRSSEAKSKTDEYLAKLVDLMQEFQLSQARTNGITVLNTLLRTFTYDYDEEKTFAEWYTAHGSLFTPYMNTLKDSDLVSVLLSKISQNDFEQFTYEVSPRKPNDFSFQELVDKLREMFGPTKSMLMRRYELLNFRRIEMDPLACAARLNRLSYLAEMDKASEDEIKCLLWITGLPRVKDRQTALDVMKAKPDINMFQLSDEVKRLNPDF